MSKIPIGLELYSVRNECAADLPGTLAAVAKMGYTGVEFAGFHNWAAADLRKLLDDTGLICCGSHTPISAVLDDQLEATMEFNATIGNQYLIIPGLPGEYTCCIDAWKRTAELFNQISAKVRAKGFWTGYHNHHTEFTATDGTTPWDTFFGNTVPDVVMQLDMGNGLMGGADLVGILKQYPHRALTVHLKPYSTVAGKDDPHQGFAPLIGEDSVPWAEVFALCESTGDTKWYIVEYEDPSYPALEAVDRCLQALRAMGK